MRSKNETKATNAKQSTKGKAAGSKAGKQKAQGTEGRTDEVFGLDALFDSMFKQKARGTEGRTEGDRAPRKNPEHRRRGASEPAQAEEVTPEEGSGGMTEQEKKWGIEIISAGYTIVPNILLEKQHALGLQPADLNVLLILLKHWWEAGKLPYPSKETIAKCIGVSSRTVQRSISKLRNDGLIATVKRPGPQGTNQYSFAGLIKQLKPHARDALEQRELHREEREARIQRKRARNSPVKKDVP